MQEPRQLYGLGSLVKSIGKGIKKIVKSPVGKAALLIGGAGLAGLGPAAGLRTSSLGNFLFGGATKFLPGATAAMKGAAVTEKGIFSKIFDKLGTGGTLGIGGGLITYLLSEGKSEEEIDAITQDKDVLSSYLRDYFTKTNPRASEDEITQFVETNTREFNAIGGRVGFQGGGADASLPDFVPPPASGGIADLPTNIPTGGGGDDRTILKRVLDNPVVSMVGSVALPQSNLKKLYDFLNFANSVQNVKDSDLIFGTGNTYQTGGRVGLESGTPKKGLEPLSKKDMEKFLIKGPLKIEYDEEGNRIEREIPKSKGPYKYDPDKKIPRLLLRKKSAVGGLQGMPTGIMRTNPAGVMERDYRDEGGFVPVGIKERADDVPAMLSKNEFVMTADAVRGAGDGSIEKGAQRMYDQMKKLESRVV